MLAHELLFTSQRVHPAVLQREGYRFQHADLEAALRSVLDSPGD
jgi:NAD dependent epimerase/dehydratase family enzyme